MKVKKVITVETEVEVDLDAADIRAAILDGEEECEPEGSVLRSLNSIAAYMKAVPDEVIGKVSPEVRAAAAKFFREQADRYAVVANNPAAACENDTHQL